MAEMDEKKKSVQLHAFIKKEDKWKQEGKTIMVDEVRKSQKSKKRGRHSGHVGKRKKKKCKKSKEAKKV